MVVEPVQDLDVGPVGEGPVGEVRLPGLVGLVGLKADVGAAGSFRGFRGDQARSGDDAPDGGDRGRGEAFVFEVPGDRDRTGVETLGVEPGSEGENAFTNRWWSGPGAGLRPSAAGLEGLETAVLISGDEGVDPLPGDIELLGRLRFRQALLNHGQNDHARLRHDPSSKPATINDVATHLSTMS